MKEYQILTKFNKESYIKISEKAEQLGLPKSTLVRFIMNKAIRNEL
jgi:DNA-binding MarR family transcriptional regulator|tara:strand:+ start:333 stop:470 length:138 start_codon:yes stop_codon:yes gene_type:complete